MIKEKKCCIQVATSSTTIHCRDTSQVILPSFDAKNAATGTTITTSPDKSPLDDINILQIVLSFVGKNQYRFVAAVSHDFKAAYIQTFPYNKRTYYNTSTVQHATICYNECVAQTSNVNKQYALCNSAARHGNLPALQYLRSMNCSWNSTTCALAAQNGHLHVLQWARVNGCPWGSKTCANAALSGHLDILQWAREYGCPWDSETCTRAACYGHFALLQWAVVNGCRCDTAICTHAAMRGDLTLLRWAQANGCSWDPNRILAMEWLPDRYPEIVEWILSVL
jgi:hypothetical protein